MSAGSLPAFNAMNLSLNIFSAGNRVGQGQPNGLQARERAIRWMLEDARKFAAREVRRGRAYHGILVDPPRFGRGRDKEVWEIFEHLPELLRTIAQLLDPAYAFMILTAYAIRASSVSIGLLAREALVARGETSESGELAIAESSGKRLLPTALLMRWRSGRAPL